MAFLEAVSISGLLGNVGTFAGIAAALAVAVVAVLVLNQGRDVKNLRDEVESESNRAYAAEAALAAEVAGVARQEREAPIPAGPPAQQAIPTPLPAVAAAGAASVSEEVGNLPAAPASISGGSPPLGSATPAPAVAEVIAATVPDVDEASVVEQPSAPVQFVSPPASDGVSPADRQAPIVIPSPSGATPAARSDVSSRSLGAPVTAAAGGAARAPRPPATQPAGRKKRKPWAVVLAALVVLAAVIFGVSQLGGGSSSTTTSTQASKQSGTTAVVAVLNGTPVSGLAGQVSKELVQDGFKKGVVTTATNQQQQTTTVAYLPGHAVDAEAVSRALGLTAAPVAADSQTQAVACPDAATCTAQVIVTVGADRTR